MRTLLCALMLMALTGPGAVLAADTAKERSAEPDKAGQQSGDRTREKSKEKGKQKGPAYPDT